MKKNLLCICLLSAFLILQHKEVIAQTAASATWSLSDATTGKTPTVVGSITASDQVISNLQDLTYSTSTGASGFTVGGGWQRLNSNIYQVGTPAANSLPYVAGPLPDYTVYAEYKVTVPAGTAFQATDFKISILGGGTGNARLVALYSLDNFATAGTSLPVSGSYYSTTTSAMTTYSATEAQPVVLLNTSTAIGDGTGVSKGWEVLTFSGMNISVAGGKTLSIRLYPFLSSSSTSARYLISQKASISGTTAIVTPLNLTSFSAKAEGVSNQVKLSWTTTNEVNTKNFIVERKAGSDFQEIGTVGAKGLSGDNGYSFVDNSAVSGVNYYRLKQVDNNGSSQFSKIISVENKGTIALSAYPNPASGSSITVSHPAAESATLKVVTLSGATVSTVTVSGGATSTAVDISGLAAGYYLIVFSNGVEKSSVKFVKQ